MKSAELIVIEEWHKAVKEFRLQPSSPTELVVSRILERIRATGNGRSKLCDQIRVFISRHDEWIVKELLDYLDPEWPRKQVYNAIANFVRRGVIKQVKYGQYRVTGREYKIV